MPGGGDLPDQALPGLQVFLNFILSLSGRAKDAEDDRPPAAARRFQATSYKGEALFACGIIWSNSVLRQAISFGMRPLPDERTADGNH